MGRLCIYKFKKGFADAVSAVTDGMIDAFSICGTIDESEDIVGIEATRVHNGFYGIISSTDFAASHEAHSMC